MAAYMRSRMFPLSSSSIESPLTSRTPYESRDGRAQGRGVADYSASAGTGVPALRTNPSEETIRLGPLSVRFLVTADNSTGSVAVFEVTVPARQRLAELEPRK